MSLNLSRVTVVGFFSLPGVHSEVAEAQPQAFQLAWQQAGPNAGTCAACGTGILHHVVVQDEAGAKHYIGTDCAERVGDETVRRCVREKLTTEQLAEKDRQAEARCAEFRAHEAARLAKLAARAEALKDILQGLAVRGTSFHASLAEQLRAGPLSHRQAEFVAKAIHGRCTKKNNDVWCAVYDRCVEVPA